MNHAILARVVVAQEWIRRRLPHEDGQGLVDYTLVLALIAIVVIVVLKWRVGHL